MRTVRIGGEVYLYRLTRNIGGEARYFKSAASIMLYGSRRFASYFPTTTFNAVIIEECNVVKRIIRQAAMRISMDKLPFYQYTIERSHAS